MNITQLLKNGVLTLSDRKTANLDAEVLLAFVLGEGREYLLAHSDEEVSKDCVSVYESYLGRVSNGEPVAYIVNNKEFFGLNFFVDNRVLIPRPESEMLVEKVLEYIAKSDNDRFRVLDMGTGSGNLAVSVVKGLYDLSMLEVVDAVDLSNDALDVARVNVEQHGVEDYVHLFNSNLFESFEKRIKYDIIMANLPYIGDENDFVEADVKKYEPNSALFAGEKGSELYKKMFQGMAERGVDFDFFVAEFGSGQRESIKGLLDKYFKQKWMIQQDLAGCDRIFIIQN